jgi:hypothetical protein
MNHNTREQFLNAALSAVKIRFADAGYPISSPIRLSIGQPIGTRGKNSKRAIAQVWPASASADGTHEMFFSPRIDDPSQTLVSIVHEVAHVAAGLSAGHGKGFAKIAKAVGLLAPWTSTPPSAELSDWIATILPGLPAFKHAALDLSQSPNKKQGTRMIKLECSDCGWSCRTAQKNVDAGLPTCHCGGDITPVEAE